MTRRAIWMFSGQGSQYYQMARDFYAEDPVFRRAVHRCDDVVYPHLGESLADLVYRPRPDRFAAFDELRLSHPALFAMQYACAEMLLAQGRRPDAILGYSLGECVAWTIAGAIRLEDALGLLMRQAALLERYAPPGAMLAVLEAPSVLERCGLKPSPIALQSSSASGSCFAALSDDEPASTSSESALRPASIWIATRNAPRHFVLSGRSSDIDAAALALARLGVVTAPLPVRFAFHTPLVDPIEPAFRAALQGIAPRPPRFALLSGDRGRAMTGWSADGTWDCLRNAIDFETAVHTLEAQGPATYLDLGPSGTMATLVKQNLPPSSSSGTHAMVTPFGVSRL